MQSAFEIVVFVVCGVGVLGAVLGLIFNRSTWDSYGQDHLLLDSDLRAAVRPATSSAAERDLEIRQMLEARNARNRRRGEPEIDIDVELARLTAPVIDAELRQEIRDLVIARNHRRARRGEPALDVETEVARQIAALTEV